MNHSIKYNMLTESPCTQPFKDAWNFIKNIPSQIVNAFKNMHITIPTPKLPHINVSYGSFLGVQYPKFSISWWAKGGFFDGASMIGVGEAGKEAVLPLENKRNMTGKNEILEQYFGNIQQ